MLTHAEYIDDAHEYATDHQGYARAGWYAVDMNGLVAGPFDDIDQTDWWIDRALRV